MSTGIGTIDCTYCVHFKPGSRTKYLILKEHSHECTYHNIQLPKLESHLICNKFKPDKDFKDHVTHMLKTPSKHYSSMTAEEAITKQMKPLEKMENDTLYIFSHKAPANIKMYKKIKE